MPTTAEARRALEVVTTRAVRDGVQVLRGTTGVMQQRREVLFDRVPSIIIQYSQGTAALAADYYADERRRQVGGPYEAALVIPDRRTQWRTDTAWASQPLADGDYRLAEDRLRDVIQLETAQPFRHTVMGNVVTDSRSVGWRRVPNPGACKFCMMLADRGAVYKSDSVYFAAHPNCMCGVQPMFRGGGGAVESGDSIYTRSRTAQTAERRARLRDYLNSYYGPDSPTPARG